MKFILHTFRKSDYLLSIILHMSMLVQKTVNFLENKFIPIDMSYTCSTFGVIGSLKMK